MLGPVRKRRGERGRGGKRERGREGRPLGRGRAQLCLSLGSSGIQTDRQREGRREGEKQLSEHAGRTLQHTKPEELPDIMKVR